MIRDAESRQANGDLDKGMANINMALEIEPFGTVALYQKGLIYLLKGRYDSAIVYCNKAIETKGSDTSYFDPNLRTPIGPDRRLKDVEMKLIRYCRGFSFYMLDKDDKALDDFAFCFSEGFNNKGSMFLYAGTIFV